VYTGFWWGNLWERDHLGDPGVDGWIILRWIFRKWDVGIWNGPRPTPLCISLPLYTLHIKPQINSTSSHLADLRPTSNSLHFTSLHFTSLHFTSLHFTSLHFTSLHFPSLNTFKPFFLEILDFLRTSKSHHFTSLHLTLS